MSLSMSFDEIKRRIMEKKDISEDELTERIKKKMDALSGLVSKEGAAHIVANELGIKLFESTQGGKIEIKNLIVGMRNLELAGVVRAVYEVRSFTRKKDGSPGKVGSFLVADKTGVVRVVMWGDRADTISTLSVGDVVKLTNGFVKKSQNNRFEVHLNDKSTLSINPEGLKGLANEVGAAPQTTHKMIQELQGDENRVEITGTLIQIFDIRFYEVCPECNKRTPEKEGGFSCPQHGAIEKPGYSFVMNVFLDDGTGEIRVVCFKNQALSLIGKTEQEVLAYRQAPHTFEEVKNDLLGKIVRFLGRVSKNDMFDRLEFVAMHVTTDIDPDKEIARLDKEIARLKKEKEPQEKPVFEEKPKDPHKTPMAKDETDEKVIGAIEEENVGDLDPID